MSIEPVKPGFTLAGDESLASGLRRVALEQLDYAMAVLTVSPLDVGVHESRKSLRRVRALLRLVRDPLGQPAYFAENRALRDAGSLIGASRDATVMVETVTAISLQYQDVLVDGVFDVLGGHLLERDRHIRQEVSGDRLDSVLVALQATRDRFSDWPMTTGEKPTLGEGYGTVEQGIRRVYRRGRRGMADAYREGTPEAFHEWRKRVRYLRYQMTLLKGMWPQVQSVIVKDLAALAEALGTANDLAVLGGLLANEPDLLPDENARSLLQGLLVQNRTRLESEAALLGARLYAERPRAFADRLGKYWDVWRRDL